MAAVVIRGSTKAAWLTGLASLRARACGMVRRGMAYAAAAIMACAVGAALLQVAAEIVSFPAPIAVIGLTMMAAAAFRWLRRHRRSRPWRCRSGAGGLAVERQSSR